MALAARRRVQALLVAAAVSAMSVRGLCFMPAMAPASPPAHDCCKTGWTAAPPACCMDGQGDQDRAIRTAKQAMPVLSAVAATFACVAADTPLALHYGSSAVDSYHSPPQSRVLRI